ncbi:MAG: pkb-activating kinase-like protein [Icmadophila ericetorum]|nr:pkb-activating kinase-like protein [Icmadophila ericetorum]
MDGDLSLSQSFGGLRIANPDDVSLSSQSTLRGPDMSAPSEQLPSLPAVGNQDGGKPLLTVGADNTNFRSPSPLGFDPSTYTLTPSPVKSERPPLDFSKPPPPNAQRSDDRQALPLTYQDQQQVQYSQYNAHQNHRPSNASSRPSSTFYAQPSTSNSSLPGSYRLHKESSRTPNSGNLRRTGSRGAAVAMQAGVPSREGSYSDRSYRNSHAHIGNGPLPPRKSSRGMGNGHLSNGGPGLVSLAGSPYNIEGGPAASSEEWKDRGAAVGVQKEIDANGRPVNKYVKKGVKDFNFGRTLGEGSYSTVIAATDRQTLKEYAIKVLDKRHIIKEKKVKYVNIEKDTLNRLTDHPGVVRLYYTFQDESSLYFVLDLADNGELLGVLKKLTTFDVECTRFYGAQILDTIDYMHSRGVIHRDLKPENVLLDDQMHVKITDFGTAKILSTSRKAQDGLDGNGSIGNTDGLEDNRANSFVGTAEYVSPELLTEKNACKASDLWAFGCIIYQLLAGRPPFKAGNEYLTFQKIVNLDYKFPDGFPPAARDLIERLLVLDPTRRLMIDHIKSHEFFDGITWGHGLWRQKAPRLKPYIPPSSDAIKLNGSSVNHNNGDINGDHSSYPPDIPTSHSTKSPFTSNGNGNSVLVRPSPRIITELPPPSQLDIEWSPVLTKNNERILKLGNLLVLSSPAVHNSGAKNGNQHSDNDGPSKLARFFGAGNTKKRERLVMVTSSARIIIAASGGDEKKTKTEIPLLVAGCTWRKAQDPKGLTHWRIDSRDKHYTFEDPKAASSDGSATAAAAQEWIEAIERAKEIAVSHNITSSYSGDDAFKDLQSGLPSPASTLDMATERRADGSPNRAIRHTLQKHGNGEIEIPKGFKRFSKRQSKQGLAAVF